MEHQPHFNGFYALLFLGLQAGAVTSEGAVGLYKDIWTYTEHCLENVQNIFQNKSISRNMARFWTYVLETPRNVQNFTFFWILHRFSCLYVQSSLYPPETLYLMSNFGHFHQKLYICPNILQKALHHRISPTSHSGIL